MLITKGKIAPSEPWNILEVARGQAPDVMAIRVSKELKRIPEPAMEALVPFRRDANGDPEWIVEHVYVRGANGSLSRLARVPGIDFIRPEIAERDWIEQLLKQERLATKPKRITAGSFVRVLTGPCARLCGHLAKLHDGTATVAIAMCTKQVTVHTYLENLQIVQCPTEQRVFFYQPDLFS